MAATVSEAARGGDAGRTKHVSEPAPASPPPGGASPAGTDLATRGWEFCPSTDPVFLGLRASPPPSPFLFPAFRVRGAGRVAQAAAGVQSRHSPEDRENYRFPSGQRGRHELSR